MSNILMLCETDAGGITLIKLHTTFSNLYSEKNWILRELGSAEYYREPASVGLGG